MTTRQPARAALYARVSTDKQSKESPADQLRVCERLVEREGFMVVGKYVDDGISGGTSQRPQYQDMLASARRGEIDIIVAEDLKRLWREQAEQWRAIKELLDLGIAFVTVSGIDSRQANFEMIVAVMGAAGELDRKEAGYRTHRGLEGLAIKHQPTGGRAFGYISATDSGTGKIEINHDQAEIVRRIFSEYAEGHSPRQIAAKLNVEGIPSPGASWKRNEGGKRRDGKWQASAIHGEVTKGTGILNNERYIGRIVWGRTKWRRGAADSLKRTVIQLATPLQSYQDERLRIVPQDLWDAVRQRQASVMRSSSAIRNSLKSKSGRPPGHLISGLVTCGVCKGNYVIVNAREYGCATHKEGGPAACSNSIRLKRKELQDEVLRIVREVMLSPESVKYAEEVYRAGISRSKASSPKAPSGAALASKEREIEQLKGMLRAGTLSPTVAQAAIAAAESERVSLTSAQRGKSDRQESKVSVMLPRMADQFRVAVSRLPELELLPSEKMEARAMVAEILDGKPSVVPQGEQVGLRIGSSIRPLLRAAGANVDNVVAGVGFEPTTFGL